MADISMCRNEFCTLKETCYRFNAPVNEYRQSYANFKQDTNGKCDSYWEDEVQIKIKNNNENTSH